MSFLRRVFGASGDPAAPAARDGASDFWFGPTGRAGEAGEAVTRETALQVPEVYGCAKVLAETISTLPWVIGERQKDGSKRRLAKHPLAAVLRDPNPEMTSVELLEQMLWDVVLEGDAIAEITPGRRGAVDRIDPIPFSWVTPARASDGGLRYLVDEPGRPQRTLLPEEVWHVRKPPLQKNLTGTGPLETGREVISAAIASQKYAARFFRNDATPPFVIENPGHFGDDASKTNFLQAIARAWGGQNRGKPAVLEYGMKAKALGISNEAAQFVQTRQAQAQAVARLWRMPPHKIGLLDNATFSNIEQQALEFVIDTLLPWLRLLEASIRKRLLVGPENLFFEFNVAGLLRGDIKARYDAYAQARQWGWLSVNEIRALENMNPVQRGDEYLRPLNMEPAGAPKGPAARAISVLRETTGARPALLAPNDH